MKDRESIPHNKLHHMNSPTNNEVNKHNQQGKLAKAVHGWSIFEDALLPGGQHDAIRVDWQG